MLSKLAPEEQALVRATWIASTPERVICLEYNLTSPVGRALDQNGIAASNIFLKEDVSPFIFTDEVLFPIEILRKIRAAFTAVGLLVEGPKDIAKLQQLGVTIYYPSLSLNSHLPQDFTDRSAAALKDAGPGKTTYIGLDPK